MGEQEGGRKVDDVKTRRRIEEWLRKQAKVPDLCEIAHRYGIEVAYGQPEQNERPCFDPNQIRCRHQLKEGCKFFVMSPVSPIQSTIVIQREPYQGDKGMLFADVNIYLIEKGRSSSLTNIPICLETYSIERRFDGTWREEYYLIPQYTIEPCLHPDCQHSCPNCS